MTDLAGRWFGVRVEYERFGPWQWARTAGRELLLSLASRGWWSELDDPKRFCDVMVYRRDTGDAVVVYDYSEVSGALWHAASLRERLAEMPVFDFCRELGIGVHHVVGAGAAHLAQAEVDWTPIRPRQRTSTRVVPRGVRK